MTTSFGDLEGLGSAMVIGLDLSCQRRSSTRAQPKSLSSQDLVRLLTFAHQPRRGVDVRAAVTEQIRSR
jgi:hypothetical protein